MTADLDSPRRVAVIGAGASGTLTAIQLLRAAMAAGHEIEVQLVERRGQHGLGRGVAYGTQDARHRLNVPAAGMSALPDEPDLFLRWCEAIERPAAPDEFVERRRYARYLRDLLLRTR